MHRIPVKTGIQTFQAGGTYLACNLLGDEGSYKNTVYWALISSGVIIIIGNAFTQDSKKRIIIAIAGLPIGAAIGFNSNEIFDW